MKKIALIIIFIYIFIGDVAALKIRDITNITPTIAAWYRRILFVRRKIS